MQAALSESVMLHSLERVFVDSDVSSWERGHLALVEGGTPSLPDVATAETHPRGDRIIRNCLGKANYSERHRLEVQAPHPRHAGLDPASIGSQWIP